MKNKLAILFLLALAALIPAGALAQDGSSSLELPSVLNKAVAKWGFSVSANGDTIYKVILNNITVYPAERFKSKADEDFYWKTVRDVKRTLPYAKLINTTLQETYEYLQTFSTQKEKEEYLKQFEKAIFNAFRAGFWQTFGRFFGVNMREGFHPDTNKTDALIERICVRIEQGSL